MLPGIEPDGEKILRFYVIDQFGNKYIAHATSADSPEALEEAFDAVTLPEGWKKEKKFLTEDFTIRPAEGSDGSFYYLVLRDAADIGKPGRCRSLRCRCRRDCSRQGQRSESHPDIHSRQDARRSRRVKSG